MPESRPSPTVIRRRTALADGFTDHDLRISQRSGDLTRLRRGSYVAPAELESLGDAERHRLASLTAASDQDHCVVSHASAAACWRLPLYRVDTTAVHFTRPGARSGRRTPARIDHAGVLRDDERTTVDAVVVTTVARTLVDLARSESSAAAVVAADCALRRRMTTPADLREAMHRCAGLPGIRTARRALQSADGRAESPGESLTRLALSSLPALDSQVTLTDDEGRFVARTDFAVRESLLVIEFDGQQKYLASRAPGQSLEQAVLAEKRREDAIRGLGYLVLRVVWRDLDEPQRLRQRVARALQRGRELTERGFTPAGSYRPAAPVRISPTAGRE